MKTLQKYLPYDVYKEIYELMLMDKEYMETMDVPKPTRFRGRKKIKSLKELEQFTRALETVYHILFFHESDSNKIKAGLYVRLADYFWQNQLFQPVEALVQLAADYNGDMKRFSNLLARSRSNLTVNNIEQPK